MKTESMGGDPFATTYDGFDEVTGKGLECQVCHALVRKATASANGHRKWHESLDGG